MVRKKIDAVYVRGLGRCVTGAPTEVDLAFTISDKGRATNARAATADADAAACMEQRLPTWTFPIPRDAAGAPTAMPVKLALTIAPAS